MLEAGVEPARLAAQDPKSCVSANSTTQALKAFIKDYRAKKIKFFNNLLNAQSPAKKIKPPDTRQQKIV